jgi:hypothetical protein
VAQDGTGRNGIFTGALLNYIGSDLTIEDLFKKVTGEVRKLSGGGQNPWINVSLSNDFYFVSESIRAQRTAAANEAAAAARKADLAEAARAAAQAASVETQKALAEAEAAKKTAADALAAKAAFEAKAAAEATRPKGKVRIESYETGEVFVGSELLGEIGPESPLMADSLPTGRQEFRFVRQGQPDTVKAATLGEKVYVTVTFGTAPVAAAGTFPGSLSVSVDLDDVKASLDDADDVVLPHVFEGLIPGEHTLVIRETMYQTTVYAGQELKVTVVAGRQVKVRPELQVGQGRLVLRGFPAGSTLSVNGSWQVMQPAEGNESQSIFDGNVDAGTNRVVVTLGAVTWESNTWLGVGRAWYLTPSSMHKVVTLQKKNVQLTGKDTDFSGIDMIFGASGGAVSVAPFKGYSIAGGTLCRDANNLYVLIRYSDGKPETARTVSRFAQLDQGAEQVNLVLDSGSDGMFHTGYWNDRIRVWSDGGAYTIGKDFLEMRFSLGTLGKSFLNPRGFDFSQPIKINLATWFEDKKYGVGTSLVEVIVGPQP